MAEWVCNNVDHMRGIINLPGPLLQFGQFLEVIKLELNSRSRVVWMDEAFLLNNKVQPWLEIPLWLPKDLQNFFTINDAKALAGGLSYRPLSQTILDTAQWLQSSSPNFKIVTGLDGKKECELLATFKAGLS